MALTRSLAPPLTLALPLTLAMGPSSAVILPCCVRTSSIAMISSRSRKPSPFLSMLSNSSRASATSSSSCSSCSSSFSSASASATGAAAAAVCTSTPLTKSSSRRVVRSNNAQILR